MIIKMLYVLEIFFFLILASFVFSTLLCVVAMSTDDEYIQ